MTELPGKRDPDSGAAGTAASNGETVPDESASADSLRRQSDEHPASDRQALSDHVQSRRGDEPTGLTRDSKVHDADADGARRGRPTAVPATADERAVIAAGGEVVATSTDDEPEYQGPNSL